MLLEIKTYELDSKTYTGIPRDEIVIINTNNVTYIRKMGWKTKSSEYVYRIGNPVLNDCYIDESTVLELKKILGFKGIQN